MHLYLRFSHYQEIKILGNVTFTAKLNKTGTEKMHQITLNDTMKVNVVPPPMVAENADRVSPHSLFLASIGSCVNLIFEIAMGKAHLELIDINSTITGDYVTDESTQKSYFNAVNIDTEIVVPEGVNENRLKKLFEMAKNNCPVGNCLVGSKCELNAKVKITYK